MADDNSAARLLVQMEADIAKFEDNLARAEKRAAAAAKKIEDEFHKRNGGHAGLFGNPGEALEKTFDRSRFAVLEEGAAKVPIFGSALEALGPAGLTAAAGIAAAAFAMEQAEKAATWAKGIEDGAKKVGVTTTALQEYRLMMKEVGASEQDADKALLEFNQHLGAAQSGFSAKAIKPFQQLGFTPEELKAVKNGADMLPEIADRVSHLKSAAEQAHIAEKLGLSPMLPLLREGAEKIRDMQGEFQKLGLIMDRDMVKRGAEAAREFEKASKAVDIQLKEAFIELAPILVATMQKVAEIARSISDIVQNFNTIDKRADTAIEDKMKELTNLIAAYDKGAPLSKVAKRQVESGDAQEELIQLGLELARRRDERAKEVPEHRVDGTSLTNMTTPKANPTAELDAKAKEIYESELKKLAEAQKALETNLQARAALEKKAIDADAAKTVASIDAEIAKIKQSQLDTHKKAQIAELTSARAAAQKAALDQKTLIDRQTADAAARTALELDNIKRSVEVQALDLAKSEATSRVKRMQIENDLLTLAQKQERAAQEMILASQTATSADKKIAQAKLDQLKAEDTIKRAGIALNNLSPGQAYVKQLNQSLDESGQKVMVSAIEHLNDGLVKALENTRNLGKVFREVAQQIVADLLRLSIEKGITQPLANALFGGGGGAPAAGGGGSPGMLQAGFAWIGHLLGFAGGGDPPVGVPSMVGERGPELFVPKTAGTIVPTNLLSAIAAASMGARASGAGRTVSFSQTIDLTGANGEDTIARIAHAKAMEGAAMALEASRREFGDNFIAAQTLSL